MCEIMSYDIEDVRRHPQSRGGEGNRHCYDINKVYEPHMVGPNVNKE